METTRILSQETNIARVHLQYIPVKDMVTAARQTSPRKAACRLIVMSGLGRPQRGVGSYRAGGEGPGNELALLSSPATRLHGRSRQRCVPPILFTDEGM